MIAAADGVPLRGIAAAGFATDPRAERAYEWLLAQRLDDGSWPVGDAVRPEGLHRRVPPAARIGRLPRQHDRRAGVPRHPPGARRSEAARIALDLLLPRETRDESTLGWEVARLVGLEAPTGFVTFYARFDLAFVLELASRCGAARDDARVGRPGRVPGRPARPVRPLAAPGPSRARPLADLRPAASLRRLEGGDWIGLAPAHALPRLPEAAATLPRHTARDGGGPRGADADCASGAQQAWVDAPRAKGRSSPPARPVRSAGVIVSRGGPPVL